MWHGTAGQRRTNHCWADAVAAHAARSRVWSGCSRYGWVHVLGNDRLPAPPWQQGLPRRSCAQLATATGGSSRGAPLCVGIRRVCSGVTRCLAQVHNTIARLMALAKTVGAVAPRTLMVLHVCAVCVAPVGGCIPVVSSIARARRPARHRDAATIVCHAVAVRYRRTVHRCVNLVVAADGVCVCVCARVCAHMRHRPARPRWAGGKLCPHD